MADEFATALDLSVWTGGKIAVGDPRSEPLLEGASAGIRRYCGWHISPSKTETLTLDGSGGRLIQLPTLHVTAVVSVKEDGEVLDPDCYEWSATGELRRLHRWWSNRYRSLEVQFTHGYNEVPDLKQIVLQVCAAAVASPMGATVERAGQVSVQWGSTAPGVAGGMTFQPRDLEIINQYKLPGRL